MSFLENKTVLITGGTGSFGSTVLSKFTTLGASKIKVFSRDEKKQFDLRKKYLNSDIEFIIGDVRDEKAVNNVTMNVDYIFHAAALKQVPSCEFFPLEAVKTNVLGTNNVVSAAIQNGVEAIVCLSTDKAVYPINAMGISKAMMEKTAQSFARFEQNNSTKICVTRYGNVISSRGSVIPEFISRGKQGKPLLVTDPKMSRFLMSLDDSVDLVLHGLQHGETGDLFVRKAPACTIGDLAEAVNNITENTAGVELIGSRHGEKKYESLLTKEELSSSSDMGNYFRVKLDSRDQNYDVYFDKGDTKPVLEEDYNSHNTTRLSVKEIEALLLKNPETLYFLRNDK